MLEYGKTNNQIAADVSSLQAAIDESGVSLYSYDNVGLKDGSGNNGDLFIQDVSLYIKLEDVWWFTVCASANIGA